MALDQDLIDLMTDQVTIELATGHDSHNNTTFGSPTSVDGYIYNQQKKVIDRSGKEVVSEVGVILAKPELEVTTEARITLPNGRQPEIKAVLSAKDDLGDPFYLEVRA